MNFNLTPQIASPGLTHKGPLGTVADCMVILGPVRLRAYLTFENGAGYQVEFEGISSVSSKELRKEILKKMSVAYYELWAGFGQSPTAHEMATNR